MNKKGKSTRLDMNDLEKEFLTWYKNKFPNIPIEKNIESITIWESRSGKEKITYTPDFKINIEIGMENKSFMIEVKGWSRSNELWDLKRKLVIEHFEREGIYFYEYRKLGKEFFEYNQWLFETKKRKAIKKYEKEIKILNTVYLKDNGYMKNNTFDGKYGYGMPIKKWERKLKHNTKMLEKWSNIMYNNNINKGEQNE